MATRLAASSVVSDLVPANVNDARAASLLERLGELAGIEPSYRNYFGAETVASPETTRAILAALGFDVDDAQGLKKTVAALESAPWRRRIDPVTIAMHGTVARIGIVSAEAPFPATIEWNLTEEHGRKHNGIWSRSAQPAVGERIIEDERRERRLFDLPPTLPLGYHRLEVHGFGQADFIVAPSRCYLPPAVAGGAKLWGVSAQLYGLRSQRNWGMGDFTDLRTLVTAAHGIGAAAVGVNPLHELDPHNPDAASPYSPSSRLHLNVAYLDVEAVPDFQDSRDAQRLASETAFVRRLRELRAAPLVDYGGVAACKRPVLELCYRSFRRRHLSARSERARAFWAFVAEGGEKLERLAIYEALREWIGYGEHSWSWETWPQGLRDPRSADVHAFATEQRERVEFFCYLQWNADLQLAGAASACSRMPVGLYRDLAVGVDGASAETWADPESLVRGVTVGAPPDALNVHGQNWGLLPFHPMVLRKRGFAPFVALIRANMRHAGALRIDHAMSLQRLFWIPAGRSASEGAYVRYPLAELLALVALESERNRCLVIGEDLGTVPEGFRERLQWSRIFSYRLLYFERDHDGAFKPPDEYPPLALVSTGTHDLPTLPGFWKGEDLLLRARLALLRSDTSLDQEQRLRQHERAALIAALLKDGDVAHALAERLRIAEANASAEDLRQLVEAAYHFLAKSRSRLLMASLEDVLGVLEQSNVPGTTSEHPNWRRKLPMEVEALARDERVTNFAAALHNERALSAPPTVPSATYRLQFHGGFRFTDAQRIVPYLHALGISHVYASPIFAARPGSTHGYDVVDHAALNPELGTRADFEDFVAELHRSAMGLVVDFVPNHTGIGAENPWWQDVLEWGRASPYAAFFDIDWNPAQRALRGKLLLPFLGAPYGDVLERGELRLAFDSSGGTFALIYEDQRFPLAPHTYASVLRFAADAAALRREPAAEAELRALCWSFERCLPKRGATVDVLRQHAGEAKRRLTLASRAAAIAQALEDALKRLAGKPGAPSSFEELHRLVLAQHYRPAFWRVALDEINYRRFFDINDLAGLRMEVAECFALVHRFVFRLIEDGLVQGLRIDHVDGLYDPKAYTTLLRIRAAALDYPLYLIVEKILARHESLRDDWLVAGTTGYEFLNAVNGLFVDAQSERRMEAMYRAFTAERRTFEEILAESKRLIMDVNLASELEVLANQLDRIAQTDRRSSDLTRVVLRDALADVIEAFPVYRTYVDGDGASAEDRRYLDWALAQARKRTSALDLNVFTFLEAILSTDATRDPRSRYRMRDVVHFAMKFQQYTAPVMAKAYEDTAFYRYARLISLN
ncbi:MAG: malto-oligosyltrehalose synthase, partial [Candidatus Eremiobacteraeota bacterium]|nr:malto-oligosyltrehalose synthase [Candidatus Eremiobacteraeota bacterium]